MTVNKDFLGFCRQATDSQLENILRQEYNACRTDETREGDYHAARIEAERRGWTVVCGERQ